MSRQGNDVKDAVTVHLDRNRHVLQRQSRYAEPTADWICVDPCREAERSTTIRVDPRREAEHSGSIRVDPYLDRAHRQQINIVKSKCKS